MGRGDIPDSAPVWELSGKGDPVLSGTASDSANVVAREGRLLDVVRRRSEVRLFYGRFRLAVVGAVRLRSVVMRLYGGFPHGRRRRRSFFGE